MQTTRRTKISVLGILIILAAFFKGLFCLGTNLPWQAADEVTHFEASVIRTGQLFGKAEPLPNRLLQKKILTSMARWHFYRFINVPPPPATPDKFEDTPFLESSPSKLGRPPLYYYISGIHTHSKSVDLLAALYLSRLINLFLCLIAVFLVYCTAIELFPQSPQTAPIAAFFMLCHPGFWHLGTAVTQQSWIVMIGALAVWSVAGVAHKGITRRTSAAWIVTLMLAAATRWTLCFPLILIAAVSVLPEMSRKRNTARSVWRIPSGFIWVLLLTCLTGLVIWIGSEDLLLLHELKNLGSTLTNCWKAPVSVWISNGVYIVESFWAGFGWLTIKNPPCVSILTSILTVWCIFAALYWFGWRQSDRKIVLVLLSYILLLAITTILRGFADDPAIQGRYLFPGLPAISLVFAAPFALKSRGRIIRRIALICLAFLLVFTDLYATLGGWYYHLRIKPEWGDDTCQAMSNLEWTGQSAWGVNLQLASDSSRHFLGDGWFPSENAKKRWFRERAIVHLPLLPPAPLSLTLRVLPYQPESVTPRVLDLYWNDYPISKNVLRRGWNDVTCNVDENQVDPVSNRLLLKCPEAGSPYMQGESRDRRVLSAGVSNLMIVSGFQRNTPQFDSMQSHWLTTEEGLQICIAKNSGIRQRSRTHHSINLIRPSGKLIRLSADNPAYSPDSVCVINHVSQQFTSMEKIRKAADAIRATTQNLPGFLGDFSVQLFLLFAFVMSLLVPCFFVVKLAVT
jgi:4-amino-4-deoxy-L-arabinose transferase-like glycosyltransferase